MSEANRHMHTTNTQKSISSTTGTPPNGTPLSTVLSVEVKQLLLSRAPEGEVPFETSRIHCSHHREDIAGVEPAVCLQRLELELDIFALANTFDYLNIVPDQEAAVSHYNVELQQLPETSD